MKRILKYSLCSLYVFAYTGLFAQNSEVDSLKKVLKTLKDDTNKVYLLNKIARHYNLMSNHDSSFFYARKNKLLAEKLLTVFSEPGLMHTALQRGIAMSYNVMGLNYTFMGDYPKALNNLNTYLEISERIYDKKAIASAYGNIGNIYYEQGRYPETLNMFLLTLKIREEIKDRKGLAFSYVSLGNIYSIMHNYTPSLKYYSQAIKLFEEFGDKHSLAGTYNNIAGVYTGKNYYEQALKMYYSYIEIMKEFDDQQSIASTYDNIGNIFYYQKNYKKALEQYFEALTIQIKIDDKSGIGQSYINIGETYTRLGDYKNAEIFALKGLKITKETNELENLKHVYSALYNLYDTSGNYNKALENYKLYIIYRDSITNKENIEQSTRIEMNYEFEKKQAADKLEQSKKDAIAIADRKKQQVIIWSIGGVLILVIGFSVFVYRSSLQKQKANLEITYQKHIIEEKQKEIVDSIYYAKRIQTALLPHEKYLERTLNTLNKNES